MIVGVVYNILVLVVNHGEERMVEALKVFVDCNSNVIVQALKGYVLVFDFVCASILIALRRHYQ